MDNCALNDFRSDNAAQRLGQYNAWDIGRGKGIDLAWISKANTIRPAPHRVLPHGEPSIAILRKRDARGEISEIDLTVCGPYRRASFYKPDAGEELIGARLAPETAAYYFDVPPHEFIDSPPVTAPRSIIKACSRSLRAAEGLEASTLITILINDLTIHAYSKIAKRKPEAFVAFCLRRSQGRAHLKKLVVETGVSERHLRRRFYDAFGVTPKEYARQLRLTAAALYAERTEKPDWASIAAAFGYHDQSHMINEFQAMVQMTPRMLHRERRALLDAS